MTKQNIRRWLAGLSAGTWITLSVFAVAAGRWLWLYAERPAHGRELAAAYGSAGIFYGLPQVDSMGKRITFAETGDKGYAVFMADVATGRKTPVYEQLATGAMLDKNEFQVWPWAPDDSAFIYSYRGQVDICDPKLGKSVAEVEIPTNVASLAWLSPSAFVCVQADGALCRFNKASNGNWTTQLLSNSTQGVLRSQGGTPLASSDSYREEAAKAFDQNPATCWSSSKAGPAWLQYEFSGPAWAITSYELAATPTYPGGAPGDWELLASQDGAKWKLLDSRTNESFNPAGETRRYTFNNQVPYYFYRLNVTATKERTDAGVCLAEFQLWSEDTMDEITASAEGPATENVAHAFDGSRRTKWYTGGNHQSGWLQYHYGGGEGRGLSSYSIMSANDMPGRDPKDWNLLASNDGTKSDTLDRRHDETFDSRLEVKTYSVATATPYGYFRLDISAVQGSNRPGLQLGKLNLNPSERESKNPGRPVMSPAVGWRSLFNNISLTAITNNTIAWAQGRCLWKMNLDSGMPEQLLDLQEADLPNATLQGFSYSKTTGQYLLNFTPNTNGLWRFLPSESSVGLSRVGGGGAPQDAFWLNGSVAGWAGLQNGHVVIYRDEIATPTNIGPRSRFDGMVVSANGQSIFALGTAGREAMPGIWKCDATTGDLQCVVPNADFPSPYAERIDPVAGAIFSKSGKYTVFLPPDIYTHPRRKRPLVIGDTLVVVKSVHGRLWVHAAAACGACVVIVNRPGWWEGIERWGDDVTAAYNDLSQYLPFDKDRLFLFAVSAETTYASQFVTTSPVRWAGVIYLNPTGLPDYSKAPPSQARPRFLLNSGSLERPEMRFKQFQESSLNSGVMVEYVISPGEAHHFVGNAAQLERARAIEHFIFEE